MKYDRTKKLFGDETFNQFQDTKLILLGVGGVGSFALDALYNTGITNITIVDFDTYEDSNMNRQLGSVGNIGRIKVEALKEKYPDVIAINEKITPQWIDEFDFSSYDYILDAIDDIKPKVHLIQRHYKKVITTSGSAKRIDPSKIEYKSIWDTFNDPFIRKIRTELKQKGFKKKFKVIFSSENPNCIEKGSFEAVTGSFGLMMASVTVQKILAKMKK
ncbi:tRNA threonylcarbamoyladenosine dehydratase [Poseidonibacter ostreae]|uniref:tRNA threonylcarbamoyladenosine dehydratase n=1 Tax=Poseidonibacter ostreae TaxID=2654171 RepID=A0A6L4WNG8_9BACT|nr:ThiF family adenylyltransferase [Poseidonibacter ostreae]KAB7884494.1 tRNA threonylcarbamoyladenosine dehydratase [Poseidonibacter ostreae]KAB7889910.1 tRNA threonylcarbamoyladenosine dehydratase [Poseidonibacter ostreae]|tara:strand:- start:28 stop:678 length:651 start_codon:yes stop_codon:yes gene_type:complete